MDTDSANQQHWMNHLPANLRELKKMHFEMCNFIAAIKREYVW